MPDPATPEAPEAVTEDECFGCTEGDGWNDRCPNSNRACGHHCNCQAVHDCCHWCGAEWGENGIRLDRLFVSKPQHVEAIQWTGDNHEEIRAALDTKVRLRGRPGDWDIDLLVGKDGVMGWQTVPPGHWLIHKPGDLSDIWPVDADYFAEKYEAAS